MSSKKDDEQHVKRMADLLRQGSALTDLACPVCASPLFRLKEGILWCVICEKKVIIVKEGEEPTSVTGSMALDSLEATLLTKIQEVQGKMQHEENVDEMQKLGLVLSGLLENLEKTRRVKKV